jgi:site-specific DNA recombinase
LQRSKGCAPNILIWGVRGQRLGAKAPYGHWKTMTFLAALLRRAGKGKRLVIANGAGAEVNADLAELIKEAFAIRNRLLSGLDDSIEAMSGRLGMNKCRLTSLNRLSYLAPEIVGALLAGRHPIELTPTRLLRLSRNLPHDWKEQRRFLGFAA